MRECRVSSTKPSLRRVKPTIVQRGVGKCRKEQGFEDSSKHGKDAEGPNDVTSDRGFFGFGHQEHDGIVPPHGDFAGLQANDKQAREPREKRSGRKGEDEVSVNAVDAARLVLGILVNKLGDLGGRNQFTKLRQQRIGVREWRWVRRQAWIRKKPNIFVRALFHRGQLTRTRLDATVVGPSLLLEKTDRSES